MQRKTQEDRVVLFASPPDLNDLCSVTVRVESQSGGGAGNVTTQPKILKCREVIFTEPDVIAAPSYEQYDCFTVVMSQSLYRTGRLQARMRKNGLEPSKPIRVNPGVYQACLRYTLLARLAPAWNKAADWLIQGRDFLSHTGCANAVKCEVMVQADQLYLSVWASVLRLAPLQLADLNLSQLEVQALLYNAEHGNGELALHDAWCRVLPSMKKGRLCGISLSIPQDSPFAAYRDIKRHWKNTYGFRLPETDDDIFYAQISFCGLGGKQFTYPNICLRPQPLQCVPRVDGRPILSALLQDIHSKLPAACGHTLRFQPQLRYPLAAVCPASQDVRGPGANLSKRSSACSSQLTLRDPRHLPHSKPSTHPTPVHALKASARTPEDPEGIAHTAHIAGRSQSVAPAVCPPSQPVSQSQAKPQPGTKWSQVVKPSPASLQRVQPQLRDENCPGEEATRLEHASQMEPAVSSTPRAGFASSATPLSTPLYPKSCAVHRSSLSLHKPQRAPTTPFSGERDPSHKPLPTELSAKQASNEHHGNDAGSNSQAFAPQGFRPDSQQLASKSHTNVPPTTLTFQQDGRDTAENAPFESGFPSVGDRHDVTADDAQTVAAPCAPRKIVPVFKPKTLTTTKNKAASGVGDSATGLSHRAEGSVRIVPTFRPKLKPNRPPGQESRPHPNNTPLLSSPLVTSTTDHVTPLPSQPPPKQPQFHPRKPPHPVKGVKSHGVNSPSALSLVATPSPKTVAGRLKKNMLHSVGVSRVQTASPFSSAARSPSTPGLGSVFSQALTLTPAVTPTPGMLSGQGKRKGESVGGEAGGGEKRARNKPQVQDLDVEALARVDQLQKVNAVTLISWLKVRGVHCKAKDKKADLVDRVKVFLAITSEP